MSEFFEHLKQRKLVQWAIAYIAAAFALLQGIDIVAQQFGWPEGVRRGITIVLVVGLLVTLVLAWYHGERGAQRVSGTELLILSVVLIVGGGFLWRFTGASRSPDNKAAAQPNASQSVFSANSIAVLPFVNMSEDKANKFFSDGISEELLNVLSKVAQLQVAARTSSFSFKGKQIDVPEIARQLHVANVLEGSVRKSGDQVRITAQLIRAAEGYHLWSETYDRKLDDIFKIQDEIAGQVVKQLKVTLLGAAPKVRTTDPKAYALYLQARELGRQNNPEAFAKSDALFRQVLEIDPGYAPAWVQLGSNLTNESSIDLLPAQEGFARAREAVEKALAIDPDNA